MTRLLLAPFIIMACGVFMLWGTFLSHDISWYLISTRWWLDGLPIYAEILELNPPLAFYLTAIPVWVSGVLGIAPTAAYKGFVFALIAVSLVLSAILLRRNDEVNEQSRGVLLAVLAIALVILPIYDFGQRDHLFSILFLPFVLLSMLATPQSRAFRAGIAAWAAIGVALKHYFVLLPVVILIYQMVTQRSLRPMTRVEYLLPVALLIAYVAASYVLHPAYFNEVIPLTMQIYGAYESPFVAVLLSAMDFFVIVLLALVLLILNPTRSRSNILVVLTGAAAAALYIIQSKGWGYHAVPARLYLPLAVTWTALTLCAAHNWWWPKVIAAGLVLFLLFPALDRGPYRNPLLEHAEPHFKCAPGARTLQSFTSSVDTSFPLANYVQAQPTNRAPALWLFPGAVHMLSKTEDPAEQALYRGIMQDARARVLTDFFRVRPQVVIIDESPQKLFFNGVDFDYLAYFQKDDSFAQAWTSYQFQGRVGPYGIYARPGCDVPAP